MSEQAATQGGDQPTADERERAAEAESYGGQPIDSQELADVWTAGRGVESKASGDGASGDVVTDPAQGDEVGSDWTDEGGATPAGPATDEPTD